MKVRIILGGVNESEDNINKGEKKKLCYFCDFWMGKIFLCRMYFWDGYGGCLLLRYNCFRV